MIHKRPFAIDMAMARIREAIRPFPQAALFALAEEGFSSPFELLVACILSIRTLDAVTLSCAHRLFALARAPRTMSQLTPKAIGEAIHACTVHEAKAPQIHAMACRVVAIHGGVLPCDAEILRSFRGVGPKCAHLVLGIACQQPFIGVDIHVHRVTNRWGYVSANSPEATLGVLKERLPRDYWVEINRLLVPFGKHICTGSRPHCSTCPVREM